MSPRLQYRDSDLRLLDAVYLQDLVHTLVEQRLIGRRHPDKITEGECACFRVICRHTVPCDLFPNEERHISSNMLPL